MSKFHQMTLAELATLLQQGDVSSTDLTQHFHRIGGRSIHWPAARPGTKNPRKASGADKLDQIPLSYPTVRP